MRVHAHHSRFYTLQGVVICPDQLAQVAHQTSVGMKRMTSIEPSVIGDRYRPKATFGTNGSQPHSSLAHFLLTGVRLWLCTLQPQILIAR